MDRREAIKKLAIGGAIAAGGSIVLSTNNVAFAASGGAVAPAPSSMPVSTPFNNQGEGTLVLSAPPAPNGANPATTTYQWEIRGCDTKSGRTLVVLNAANNQVIARANNGGCPSTPIITPPSNAAGSVIVRTAAGNSSSLKDLEPGNTVTIRLIVKWYVGSQMVEGRYQVSGAYPNFVVTQA
jgi:hypothetical protein